MTTITKKQHYVPVFYLRAWNLPGKDVAHYYDLETGKVLLNKPETMLAQNYFYEQQSRFPENYIESILSNMESHVAPIFSELNEIIQNHPTRVHEDRLLGRLKEFLSMNNRDTFKEFAAYQYLRIPGAMEQKVRELYLLIWRQMSLPNNSNPLTLLKQGMILSKNGFSNKWEWCSRFHLITTCLRPIGLVSISETVNLPLRWGWKLALCVMYS